MEQLVELRLKTVPSSLVLEYESDEENFPLRSELFTLLLELLMLFVSMLVSLLRLDFIR